MSEHVGARLVLSKVASEPRVLNDYDDTRCYLAPNQVLPAMEAYAATLIETQEVLLREAREALEQALGGGGISYPNAYKNGRAVLAKLREQANGK